MSTSIPKSPDRAYLMRRKLPLEGLEESQWQQLLEGLNRLEAVDQASRSDKNLLHLTYDARYWSTQQTLELIKSYRGYLKNSWWTRRKISWYRFTDENARANAKHQPHCCSKPPTPR
ncbi:hypothetical protein [Marinospirillum perlucidum]|uniref:hypothetical protein n=1 Tax=Marinospirillum perlucidum TaxID=1982602 RepID=UPI000DF47601|nr:hypothetical protein [Marinospirillum perlucidum]